MRSKIVPISNIRKLAEAVNALVDRAPGVPGLGVLEGHTGYGKSTAVTWQYIRVNGVYVRAISASTPRSLLKSICKELSIEPSATAADTVEDIVSELSKSRRPLFIDEADYLIGKTRLIETIRDIHDLSLVPVILIGMHGFRTSIKRLKQLTGRVSQWVEFKESTLEDAMLLARDLAEVTIGADLVRKLHEAACGSVRLIVVGLARIEQYARAHSLTQMARPIGPSLPISSTALLRARAPRRRRPASRRSAQSEIATWRALSYRAV